MPVPTITPVQTFTGDLPNFLTQPPLVFAANANTSVLQWNDILLSYNTSLAEVNVALEYVTDQATLAADQVTLATAQATGSGASATAAQNSANIAAAAANFLGEWTAYGSAAIAAFAGMLRHDGSYWIPLVPLADASSVEPGTDANTWEDYIALVSGGIAVVSSPTDTSSTKVVDVAWLTSRGIGGAHDASGRTFTAPSNLAGLGIISGLCDGDTLGVPDLTGTDYGTLTIQATSADTSIANSVTLTFIREGTGWLRSNIDATTWGDWTQLGSGASGGLVEAGEDKGNVATSGSQTVTCDCSTGNLWTMSMDGANGTGALTIEFTNFPDTTAGVYPFAVILVRGGVKSSPLVISLPGGFALEWSQGAAPSLATGAGQYDIIQFRKDFSRTKIQASIVGGGTY